MCGRYTMTDPRKALVKLFPQFDYADLLPNYNVAPTQSVLGIRVPHGEEQPAPALLKWGLVPG
jgi:putative SOS response-associated peptidase YedK